jgi:cholesterol transport system auxiliary component
MPMITKRRNRRITLMLALLVAGCGNLGTPAPRFAFFELGLAAPADPPVQLAPARIDVRAPSWLSTGAMQYRFDYRSPAQREAYSETRWVAEPAEMLRLSLEHALRANPVAEGECRLRIELDDFVQVFETARDSHANVVARVALLAPRTETELARHTFVIHEAAPTPDAPGGVTAHRHAAQRLANEVSTWLAGLDPANVRGLPIPERCKR